MMTIANEIPIRLFRPTCRINYELFQLSSHIAETGRTANFYNFIGRLHLFRYRFIGKRGE